MFNANLLFAGSATQVVGLAFLANAAILARPRRAIEDVFGTKMETLAGCQEFERRKIQSLFGFGFLFLGFGLQGAGFAAPAADPGYLLLGLLGAVLGLAAVGGIWSSRIARATFTRHLREFLQRTPWPFERNIALTKEIGEVLGVAGAEADTVEEYVARVKRALGIPDDGGRGPRLPRSAPPSGRPSAVGF